MTRMNIRVLVACEESQRVCTAFRERGFTAFSADIQEPSGGYPEWHILGDCFDVIAPGMHRLQDGKAYKGIIFETMDGTVHMVDKWDLIIAHPPLHISHKRGYTASQSEIYAIIQNSGTDNSTDTCNGILHGFRYLRV